MRITPGGIEVTAKDDPRITPVGRLPPAGKLDELPQLWNVVRGDMSLVGPRPEVPRYVDLTDPLWRKVLSVRPGLTDPVTLALRDEEALLPPAPDGRGGVLPPPPAPLKLAGYRRYLERRSWRSDLGVLARSAWAVLRPASAAAPDP